MRINFKKQILVGKKFSSSIKAQMALEAIKNQETLAELGHRFEVNPAMISK